MEIKQSTQTRKTGLFFPSILILAGLILLLEKNGFIDRQTITHLLPLAPVLFGGALLVARLRRRFG